MWRRARGSRRVQQFDRRAFCFLTPSHADTTLIAPTMLQACACCIGKPGPLSFSPTIRMACKEAIASHHPPPVFLVLSSLLGSSPILLGKTVLSCPRGSARQMQPLASVQDHPSPYSLFVLLVPPPTRITRRPPSQIRGGPTLCVPPHLSSRLPLTVLLPLVA